jgi:membrane protease YdiL (CAAX protease family)
VIAMSAELVYLAGRTWLLRAIPDFIPQEIAWSAWRLVFLALYFWLFRGYIPTKAERRGMPRHPLLAVALVLVLVEASNHSPRDFPYALVLAVTTPIVGLREELFYRVILQGYLERHMRPLLAVVLASAIFTAYHMGSQPMNAVSVTGIAATGLLLGAIYQRTRNFWLVAALHAGIDILYALLPSIASRPGALVVCNVLGGMLGLIWWRVDRAGK